MRFDGDFHLHTKASDGHDSVRELAQEACRMNMRAIAVSDHSFSSLFCHQTEEKFRAQREEIDGVEGVKIYQGIEANIVDDEGTIDVPDGIIAKADVLTVGFHRFVALMFKPCSRKFLLVNGFLSERERQKLKEFNTRIFLKTLERYPVDIVAHLGHRCPVDYARVAEECAKRDVYVELNEKHILDANGFADNIGAMIDAGAKFVVGSDAHRKDRLGKFEKVGKFLTEHNVPLDRVYGVDGNMPAFKDKSGWKNEL